MEAEARLRAEAESRLKAEQARLLSNEEDMSESLGETFQVEALAPEYSSPELSWVDSSLDRHEHSADVLPVEGEPDNSSSAAPFGSPGTQSLPKGSTLFLRKRESLTRKTMAAFRRTF